MTSQSLLPIKILLAFYYTAGCQKKYSHKSLEIKTNLKQCQIALEPQDKKKLSVTWHVFLKTYSKKTFMLNTVKVLQQQIDLLQQSTEHIEMHSRRKVLLLHGITEDKAENVAALVSKVVISKLKIDGFKAENIRRCHRMGKAPLSSGKPRPILFKLCDTTVRNKIWMAKTKLKGTGVTLSELLTKNRHNLFMQARQRFGISKCWTQNGIIFVSGPDNTRHRINQLTDLNKIVLPVIDVPQASKEAPVTRKAASTVRK